LPPELPVTVRVGSGDATVAGVQQLRTMVGSGDLHVSNISGAFSTSVGSGDVDASDVGSLQAGSVGSGDLKASGIKGDAKVGSVGSGDVTLRNVGGSVHVDTLGSGDLGAHDVGGHPSHRQTRYTSGAHTSRNGIDTRCSRRKPRGCFARRSAIRFASEPIATPKPPTFTATASAIASGVRSSSSTVAGTLLISCEATMPLAYSVSGS